MVMNSIVTLWKLLFKMLNHHLHHEIIMINELPLLPNDFNQIMMMIINIDNYGCMHSKVTHFQEMLHSLKVHMVVLKW
jgi:hypothetical protein